MKNSSSAKANAMTFIKISVEATAALKSNTIGIVQTIYGAFKSALDAISSTTTVKNIKSSYTWSAAETCVFLFVLYPTSGKWMQAAVFSKASTSITVVTPTLVYGSGNVITSDIVKTYSGTAIPKYYNSTKKVISEYYGVGVYDLARVNKIIIKGIEGKTVKSIKLLNPDIPSAID